MKINGRTTIIVAALLLVMLLVTLTGCSDSMKQKKSPESAAILPVGQPEAEQTQTSVVSVSTSGEIRLPPLQ